ncbi:hypothetical protein Q4522_02510 [Oceanobacillus profundus]|nr:hypothetical protein [Oceanobacillus profundus]
MVKIRKTLLVIVGIILILIGFSIHQSYNDTKNAGYELLQFPISLMNQTLEDIENPTSASTFDPNELTSEVSEKGRSFLISIINFERDIIGALTCYVSGFMSIIFATREEINTFYKDVLSFLFGP